MIGTRIMTTMEARPTITADEGEVKEQTQEATVTS